MTEYHLDFLTEPAVLSALILGFLMAWAIGANDVANAMACTVGSNILTLRGAIIVAGCFEAAGALLASGQVTNMIREGIINLNSPELSVDVFITGMLASLLAASTWLFIATYKGWPVSTTHTIIGAISGFGITSLGANAIYWQSLVAIFFSWVLTPLISGILAYLFFEFIRRQILASKRPYFKMMVYLPVFTALTVMIFSGITLFKGLKLLGINLNNHDNWMLTLSLGLLAYVVSLAKLTYGYHRKSGRKGLKCVFTIEKSFNPLAIITAATMAFSHGSNDIANAIGPVVAIHTSVQSQTLITTATQIPLWIVIIGALGIIVGLATYGYKIMETVGTKITQLTPSRGFVAQFSTSAMVMTASGLGLPVSTTQTMVGAILGVGLARGFVSLNLNVIQEIFLSWLITVPAGALFSSAYFLILSNALGLAP